MRQRCGNINCSEYFRYGGSGISVCNEWVNSFKSFYDWSISNGYNENLSIDRIDSSGNYEPSNCRWTTAYIQTINQRLRKDNKSGYKGIDYLPNKGKWRARLKAHGVEYSLGNYKTLKEAIIARNSFILENDYPHKIQEFTEV